MQHNTLRVRQREMDLIYSSLPINMQFNRLFQFQIIFVVISSHVHKSMLSGSMPMIARTNV